MNVDTGVPGDFGMVCHRKKQRRKRQKLLIIDLFLDFAKNTTLHGLRYITEVGLTAAEKVFWVITFIISVVMCFFLIERVWHKWLYSPVIVSFNERMVSVGEVPFPSVTICPQWKFVCNDRSPYNYTSLYRKYFGRNRKKNVEKFTGEKEKFEDASLICDDKNHFIVPNRTMSDVSLVKNIDEISPNIYNVFLNTCRWRGIRLSCYDIFKKVYTSEGVCFNFNSIYNKDMFKFDSIQKEYLYLDSSYEERAKNTTEKRAVRRGRENGSKPDLDFMLMENPTESDEMCNSFSNGFKIYVQHPDDMPQSTLYYYAAIPGQVTSLALKFSVLNTSESLIKYTPELRQCYFPGDRELQYFKQYTPNNCRLECLSIFTYRRCGCVWFHMPHSNSSELCTLQSRKCVTKAQDLLASKLKGDMKDICNCLPSCNSVQYDAEILKTSFDFKKYYYGLKKLYDSSKTEIVDKNNFSRVEIYFKEPRFVSMRRSELFGLTDFLAACGGLLGLFLGFSFLSLVEIFYFCTLRLWCILRKDIKIEKKQLRESMYQKSS